MTVTENGSAGGVEVNNNNGCDEEEEELSVPRGGPIYIPNLVGPLTSVPLFQSSILQEIQDSDEDICVDELKILTDEELVDMAIKVEIEDDEQEGGEDFETQTIQLVKRNPREKEENIIIKLWTKGV